MKRAVVWVAAGLLAVRSLAACSGPTEPALDFGTNSGGVDTWFEAGREQSFGGISACNKSPEKYKIVITGIALNDPTNGLTIVDWGWNPNTFKPKPTGGTFIASSPQTLQELGFSHGPVEEKMDCSTSTPGSLDPIKDVSPEFAVRLRAAGNSDEWTRGGLTFSYTQNGQAMTTTTTVMVYTLCGTGPAHAEASCIHK